MSESQSSASKRQSVRVKIAMPEDLITAIRERVGKAKFSEYVTAAVSNRLRLDLLDELSADLQARHGPPSEAGVSEAAKLWTDHEPEQAERQPPASPSRHGD
jgi:hypothetical protein